MIRGRAGFTLVELLIALALAAIVSLLAVSATRFAAMGLDRVSVAAQRLEVRRNLEAMLRHSLEATLIAPSLPNVAPLEGDSGKVTWLALAEDGHPGLYRDELRLEGDALVLLRRPETGGVESRTVLAPRARLTLSYFDTAWRDAWHGKAAPPRLVRIALDIGDGIARPPIVVRLWATRQ